MRRIASVALSMLLSFCVMVATARPAAAYVDPGSGLVALQSAASLVAACIYMLRRRILSVFQHPNETATKVPLENSIPDKVA